MKKILNLSNHDYHHSETFQDYVSSSGLKNILVSPEYFKYRQGNWGESSKSMDLGSAVHTIILEPEKESRNIAVMPNCKRNTKAGKEVYNNFMESVDKNNKDLVIISEDDKEVVDNIKERFNSTDELKELFSGGDSEVSIFFEYGNIKYKIRPDYLKKDLVIDLKTTSKPLHEFPRQCITYNYDLSAWMYKFGADVSKYKFVVVETNPPFNFVVFTPDIDFMANGKEKCLQAMDTLSDCIKYDVWPGVELNQTLTLPSWYRRKAA